MAVRTPGDYYVSDVYSEPVKLANAKLQLVNSSPDPPAIADESSIDGVPIVSTNPPNIAIKTSNCVCDKSESQQPLERQRTIDTLQSTFVPNKPLFNDDVIIFLITPTYTRPTQMPDMTRLGQTLRLVPNVFWIVVEDAHNQSKAVENLLRRTMIPYVHLLGPRPPTHMDQRSGRGVSNRLKAFEWLRANYGGTNQKGVIYFADDDNAYDVRLFDEMRDTQIVSMFPVGLISTLGLSTPIVNHKTGKIIGFHDPFIGRRKFAVDMAGFAVNLQFFLQSKKATMPYKVGYEEDYFLKSLDVKIWQLEPKAKNCTEVLVWHTKTKPGDKPNHNMMIKVTNYNETNLPSLYQNVMET
ncbi:hypothetical protein RDWZM_003435 [Blomia tropicalis]|uniref:Galactosylgalactosylxylosylprotein 3-beta-glucuronosyltransferase n=1 Tax=Blomia tropicalis TaxID=40697 RepID=A0A9Q0RSN9_BLOTA|nr:hypothetical protein RDWZM_003435 [Blomia tropicalis]